MESTTATSKFLFHLKDRASDAKLTSDDLPLRSELFSSEQMKQHGQALAGSHKITTEPASELLLTRLRENEAVLFETRDVLTAGMKSEHWISPAGEWLLDNFYLIETQIRLAKKHLPKGYNRQLPILLYGPSAGFPRVYDIALETISHGDGLVHPESLDSFVESYQSVTTLKLGELWAIPIMLRLALIENLRRVASRITAGRTERSLADAWADQMIDVVEKDPKGLILMVADMARSNPPKSSAFVAELSRRLQGQSPALALPLTWIELWLSESNTTIEQLVQLENQKQASDQVSISNSISSLRLIGAMDWREFVEKRSTVEQVLREDPSETYDRMDFSTRDHYRHVIEKLSGHTSLSEKEIAQKAVDLARQAKARRGQKDRSAHVGFYLVDQGLIELEKSAQVHLSYRRKFLRALKQYPLVLYEGSIAVITIVFSVLLLSQIHTIHSYWISLGITGLILISTSQLAVELVNCLATLFITPFAWPRLDFLKGIPAGYRALVVVPTMLTNSSNMESLVEALEVRFLANRDSHLHFGLLTDFKDAHEEHLPEDDFLLQSAKRRIDELNFKYSEGRNDIFFLFHRPRRWNSQEKIWMGYERKRGKLADLNMLLRGGRKENFSLIAGEIGVLLDVKYVITLDTDTQLPRDSARQLVGTMAHPLNQAYYDQTKHRVTEGYGILQPRVSAGLPGMNRSWFARLQARDSGIDPYTRSVSDVYQDLFQEGSFIGKGIYDVDIFEKALSGRFPENRVLSHDLLEGCYVRSGLVSDVQLYEDSPSSYVSDIDRRHRWVRGDWQLIEWLFPSVPSADGFHPKKNPLSRLSQWKLLDNLRRSLVPIALTGLLILGWTSLSSAGFWTMVVAGIIALPLFIVSGLEIFQKTKDVLLSQHVSGVIQSFFWNGMKAVFAFICLPYEALMNVDAILRTFWRMLVTHKQLLEWDLWMNQSRKSRTDLLAFYQSMGIVTLLTVGIFFDLSDKEPFSLPVAGPVLFLWFSSPVIVWWMSRPRGARPARLNEEQISFLRKVSRKTWRFFETFVGPQDNWLPPDNFQENRPETVAHRTSPTNIGLSLLANLSAYDFGYITAGNFLERTQKTFLTMEKLKRHRGHFYNWYDSQSLKPLVPGYISTVDSGNLAGHLLTLKTGLLALEDQKIAGRQLFEGLRDTLRILIDESGKNHLPLLMQLQKDLDSMCDLKSLTLEAVHEYLQEILRCSQEIINHFSSVFQSEAGWWANALALQCRDILNEIKGMEASLSIPTLQEQSKLEGTAGDRARSRMTLIRQMVKQIEDFSSMEYEFLYDRSRCLFSIGYNVDEHRLDSGCYDLLASEARLGYFVAIAQGQIPQESWFALGRLLTTVGGDPVLISWSGSMFEYLMPLLVMPTYEHTLLDHTYKAAVKRQIEYGKQRGVPWGTSECGYNTIDNNFNYQYRAFGVPGLGFKRRLGEDLVISPYASMLALMVDAEDSCHNLQRMAQTGVMGQYGFYESVDYTPSRQRRGESSTVLRSYLAHHQGMSLLSLAYLLLDGPMQKRFEADPLFQSTLLLLQERVPKSIPFYAHSSEFSKIRARPAELEAPMRVIKTPDTFVPEVQLLSNGRYHLMVTSAGGGYSRWKNLAVTRWRQDSTCDHWGSFCYIRDLLSGEFWSSACQPTLKAPEKYEAIFLEGRVEFRRKDSYFDTYTEIVVSPEDDIELRRIRITNCSRIRRSIDVTSYTEVVLASQAADMLHPAFSNLFIQTEILSGRQAILCSRRPRAPGEHWPFMFHLMVVHGADLKEVSYDTDRAQFIGRGNSIADPWAMKQAALSGSEGSVLDPIASIRSQILLDPEQSVTVDIVTGIGETREAALTLIEKYQDKRIAERVFELAWTHSQVVLRQINATETDAQLYARMANFILYPHSLLRADPNVIVKNRRGQSGLWGYTISGDLPIVLLQVGESGNIDLVRQMIQAHAYWRLKGLEVDLVIWNESPDGYQQLLQEQILGLIAGGLEEKSAHHPGQIFVRPAEQISGEDKLLLQSVARLIISDKRGTLANQISRRPSMDIPVRLVPFVNRHPKHMAPAVSPGRELLFFNGLGGFSIDGKEYVITLAEGQVTPAPWVNVLANPHFGTIVSENGLSYTWSENAHEFRLTPWNNDPVNDMAGEAFYLRDEESGYVWSPSPGPCRGDQPYTIRHGFGYSVFEYSQDGIRSELWVYVASNAAVKFSVLKIKNVSGRPRRLSATGYVEWVLGDLPSKTAMHISTEIDARSGAIYARNFYNTEFPERVAFFHVDKSIRTLTCDRTEFLGRNGSVRNPAAMNHTHLSGKHGTALDPCAAFLVPFDLSNQEEKEIVFTLGVGHGINDVKNLFYRFCGSFGARNELEIVRQHWRTTLETIQVETPDAALNILANGWLLYQTLTCRFWARGAFYQSGGAFGFRDQLQDIMALVYAQPRIARDHLLLCAAHQFFEGDVQHWWHPPLNRGVRTHCSDDYLWLPWVICRYITVTGDKDILNEPVHFLRGRLVNPKEDSYYDAPSVSEEKGSVYDHCKKAILKGLEWGEHGIPLIGSGDWNDGMNLVGINGKGESVWLAFFLYAVLCEFSKIARIQGDSSFVEHCHHKASQLQKNIEDHAWDGQWYLRAFFDDGQLLGSSKNMECQIDSISQSWSVLSQAAPEQRSRMAMDSVDQRLIRRKEKLVQLLDPPFDKSGLNPGYIKGYVPGVRENGGQYTHAAIWAAMAFAKLGDRRAWEIFSLINPINHTKSLKSMAAYKVEPYVVAADVYAVSPHTGRGGWSWYTGSAGLMYRLIIESILGLRLEGSQLFIEPCLPADWKNFKIHYRFKETHYQMSVLINPPEVKERSIFLDHIQLQSLFIPLVDDRREHTIELRI